MTSELLEIHPLELKFTFELKKQSSCLIQLTNKTDQYVAFKVKTTSPKKYCVRPNTGIVKPKSTYDFTVTMQAQRVAPPDLICKDKFLIQSTVIPFGTAEENITSDIFSKESGKHIEEKKLKVYLSPPNSPVLTAINGDLKQDIGHETSSPRDKARHGVENIPPSQKVAEDFMGFETAKDAATMGTQRFKTSGDETEELTTASDLQSSVAKDVQQLKSSKADDFENLKSKISFMDSKLKEAEVTIMKLTQERSMVARETDKLQRVFEDEVQCHKNNSGRFSAPLRMHGGRCRSGDRILEQSLGSENK
ncbi:Vesicle-associated 2-2 -like protein [Gossypium arboreum]|uniref:Vesicle-associated 2-2-like protein n=1 Tax=Gossypium arboreum TaxID=29729 RepID=A0A0B0NW43_GOSAR|nr:Vesicle-associated 2-2 -like protein [Gossypium arboreum]